MLDGLQAFITVVQGFLGNSGDAHEYEKPKNLVTVEEGHFHQFPSTFGKKRLVRGMTLLQRSVFNAMSLEHV